MKVQTSLILGILFALIVALFAVVNVDPVTVNYFFGKSEWPLIIVILGAVFMGGIIVGSVGFFRIYTLQKNVKLLKKENEQLLIKVNNFEHTEIVHEVENPEQSEQVEHIEEQAEVENVSTEKANN